MYIHIRHMQNNIHLYNEDAVETTTPASLMKDSTLHQRSYLFPPKPGILLLQLEPSTYDTSYKNPPFLPHNHSYISYVCLCVRFVASMHLRTKKQGTLTTAVLPATFISTQFFRKHVPIHTTCPDQYPNIAYNHDFHLHPMPRYHSELYMHS